MLSSQEESSVGEEVSLEEFSSGELSSVELPLEVSSGRLAESFDEREEFDKELSALDPPLQAVNPVRVRQVHASRAEIVFLMDNIGKNSLLI